MPRSRRSEPVRADVAPALVSAVEAVFAGLRTRHDGGLEVAVEAGAGPRGDDGAVAVAHDGDAAEAGADPRAPLLERIASAAGWEAGRLVEDLELADLDPFALGEALHATERLLAWGAALQARVVAELDRRAGSRSEWVRDDVAALLTISGRAADVVVERARRLVGQPELHDALARGAVDTRRVDVLLRETDHLPEPQAREVVGAVLPQAERLPAPRLRGTVRRAALAVDPQTIERRREAAERERHVRLEPAPDAMGWIHALLPAADATAVWQAVDALAHTRAVGDDRTLGQRRADALAGVMRSVLDQGSHPDGTPLPTAHGRRPHLSVVARPESLVPGALGIGELEGYGPVPASVVREVAAEATSSLVGVDPRTGEAVGLTSQPFRSLSYRPSTGLAEAVVARDRTCTFPGCDRPAIRCDLDHVVAFDPSRPAEEQTCRSNLHALCRRHHRLKTHGRWQVERDPDTGVTRWTSPDGHVFERDPVPLDPEAGVDVGREPRGRQAGDEGPPSRPETPPPGGRPAPGSTRRRGARGPEPPPT